MLKYNYSSEIPKTITHKREHLVPFHKKRMNSINNTYCNICDCSQKRIEKQNSIYFGTQFSCTLENGLISRNIPNFVSLFVFFCTVTYITVRVITMFHLDPTPRSIAEMDFFYLIAKRINTVVISTFQNVFQFLFKLLLI